MPTTPTPADLAAKLTKQPDQDLETPEDQNEVETEETEESSLPSEPGTDPEGADEDSDDSTEDGDADALGDPGKKALDSMKTRWKEEKRKRKEAEQRLEEIENRQKKQDLSEDEQRIEQAKAEAAAEALSKANTRIVRAEVRAEAKNKVSDLDLALQLIDVSEIDVDDDGNVDEEAVQEAISDLLEKHPVLAAQRSGGGFDTARGKKKPKPPTIDEQIVNAINNGDYKLAGELKAQKIAALPQA